MSFENPQPPLSNPFSSPEAPLGGPPAYPPPTPSQGLAVTSLVLGIVGLVMLFMCPLFNLVPGLFGVIFGWLAWRKAQRGEAGGAGMALAGMITGGLAFVIGLGILILFIAVIALDPALQ